MPSLFSRTRNASSKNLASNTHNNGSKTHGHGHTQLGVSFPDEFGRVSSRGSAKGVFSTSGKKEKDHGGRQRTKSHSDRRGDSEQQEMIVEDGFLQTSMAPPEDPQQLYGYLSFERNAVLGIEDVTRLVEVVADELNTRGVTTPFLFSNAALDISPSTVRRVIQSFLSNTKFEEECRFAGPQDLAMVLRWGLARVVRVMGGQEVRGLISWEVYLSWRNNEQTSSYPPTDFARFIILLPVPVRSLLLTIFTLLTRLVAHSTTTGLSPVTLSSLFGPLFFGLGHLSMAFHYAYSAYLRSAHATEHLLLAFIRLQDAQTSASTPIPSRLKSWIKGYPLMLASEDRMDKPRKDVKLVRVSSVRRNVRMYSGDLVRTCASWSREAHEVGSLRSSREWERIAGAVMHSPQALAQQQSQNQNQNPGEANLASSRESSGTKLPPRYSDAFRKKMDLPLNAAPEFGPGTSSLSVTSSTNSSTSATSTLVDEKEFGYGGYGVGLREGEERYKSLTDLKWGEFETLGFGEPDRKKLEFDLTEGDRAARNSKRTTLTWTDFSSSGFTRTDSSLLSTLQFDPTLTTSMTEFASQAAEMHRKLKKTQRGMPSFGWDTSPVMGGEEVMEEGFLDCFCDLIYGGGWMERGEGTFRECNWALVEFKALPVDASKTSAATTGDPRTSTVLLLFEEFVPYEYRAQMISQGSKPTLRKRLPSFFSPSKGSSKQWKQAATLNGRPYVIGSVPNSPHPREVEFEAMLRSAGGVTKVITLDQASRSRSRLDVQGMGPTGNQNPMSLSVGAKPRGGGAVPQTPVKKSPLGMSMGMGKDAKEKDKRTPGVVIDTSLEVTRTISAPPRQQSLPENRIDTGVAGLSPLDTGGQIDPQSPSMLTPSGTGRKARFKIPGVGGIPSPVLGGGAGNRKGMVLTPAGYDAVEFETRMRTGSASGSGSDEENFYEANDGLPARGMTEEERTSRAAREKRREKRLSKDDAWVDIMVASQSKSRMGNQDAELRPPGKRRGLGAGLGGKSDPELASKEIAQVLAAVGVVSDDEPEPEPFDMEEGDGDDAPVIVEPRLGYFDMHPERRPAGVTGRASQDSQVTIPDPAVNPPRDGPSSYQGHGHGQFLDLSPEPSVQPPIPPRVSEDSYYSDEHSFRVRDDHDHFKDLRDDGEEEEDDGIEYAPGHGPPGRDWVRRSDGDIEVPAFPEDDAPEIVTPKAGSSRPDSNTLPSPPKPLLRNSPPTPTTTAAVHTPYPATNPVVLPPTKPLQTSSQSQAASKTAALIEMYKQKDLSAKLAMASPLPARGAMTAPSPVRDAPVPSTSGRAPVPVPSNAPSPNRVVGPSQIPVSSPTQIPSSRGSPAQVTPPLRPLIVSPSQIPVPSPQIPGTAPLKPRTPPGLGGVGRPAPMQGSVPLDVSGPGPMIDGTEVLHTPPVLPAAAMEYEVHRSSPLRYVHGAPLHNVMEEEDE